MSLSHSPQIVTNGLVLYYDAANTQKSWKGKPSTNIFGDATDYSSGLANGYWVLNDNATNNIKLTTAFASWCVQFPATLAASTQYTFSCEYRSDINGSTLNWDNDGVDDNTWNVQLTASTDWQKYTFTRTNATAGGMNMYVRRNTGGTIFVRNVQLEANAFATPFVKGTRSNTQALIDLTGNNTLTASSLTYASDNTFSFNGSSDVIRINNNLFSGTSNFTVCAIAKTTNSASTDYIFGNYGLGNNGAELYFYNSKLSQYIAGTYVNGVATISSNQWYHITSVRSSGLVTLYVNGSVDNNGSASGSIPTTNPFTIGNGHDYTSEAFGGDIAIVKVYNIALTADQVKQNYNALRGRFGL